MIEIVLAVLGALALYLFGKGKGVKKEQRAQWKKLLNEFTEDHDAEGAELVEADRVAESNLAEARNRLEEIEANEPTPIDSLDDAISRFDSSLSSGTDDEN